MISNFKETDINVTNIITVLEHNRKREFLSGRKQGRLSHGLIYIISGKAQYYLPFKNAGNRKTFIAEQGNILSLTKGSVYDFDILSDEYHYIFIDFDIVCSDVNSDINSGIGSKISSSTANGDIQARLTKLCDTAYKFRKSDNIENLFRKIEQCWFRKKPAYKLKCKSILYEILSLIIQSQTMEYIPQAKKEKLDTALAYMENHFTDTGLQVSKIAAESKLSEVHFRRLFKEIHMVTPKKHLNILRTGRAKDLLKDSSLTMTEIALKAGYSDIFYFSASFKKETGTSPSEYRKNYL